MDVESNGVANAALDADRKEAMRKAGQEYFNRVLEQATKGGDPFIRQINVKHDTHLAGISEDPDLAAFGMVLEGSKLYLLMGVLVLTQASSLVSLKGALLMMPTPGVIAFLHMLAVALATFVLSSYGLLDKPSFTVASIKGCAVQGALHGLQTWAAFSALLHGSVYLLLSAIFVLASLLELAAARRFLGLTVSGAWLISLGIGVAGAALEILVDKHHSFHPMAMILIWLLARGAEQVWHYLKHQHCNAGLMLDAKTAVWVQDVAHLEQKQNVATQLLLQNALPALPVLVVALCCLEGKELVDHEPSVPGLEVLAMSCVLYSAAAICQAQLLPHLGNRLPACLQWGAGVGSIIGDFLERAELSLLAGVAAVVALSGSTAAMWQRAKVDTGDIPPLLWTRPIG